MGERREAVLRTILVLSGGVGLGAYQAGAITRWAESAGGMAPDWVLGSSVGAVQAAVIAGTPPEARLERLRALWSRLEWPMAPANPAEGLMRHLGQLAAVATSRLGGHPALFNLRAAVPGALLPGEPGRQALYSLDPLRRLLEEEVDFDRLNGGDIRVTICATDLATGDAVLFDNRRQMLEMDHLLASCGFLPDFPPVRVGDRWLGDGGLAQNAPVEVAMAEEGVGAGPDSDCFVLDLYAGVGRAPQSLDQALERRYDLLFANQTRAAVMAQAEIGRLRVAAGELARSVNLLHLAYADAEDDSGQKAFDFSPGTLRRRWAAGERDMAHALDRLTTERGQGAGIHLHRIGGA